MVINLISEQTGIMQFVFVSVISPSKNGVVCAGEGCSMVWNCTLGCGFEEGLLVSGVVRGKPGFVVLSQIHSGSLVD